MMMISKVKLFILEISFTNLLTYTSHNKNYVFLHNNFMTALSIALFVSGSEMVCENDI